MSKKFTNILVIWGTIRQLWMFLLKSWWWWWWWWWITLNYLILGLPDTLQVLLNGFDSMAWSTFSESMVLGLPNQWSSCNPSKISWTICHWTVVILWHQMDICNTTSLNRCLHHHHGSQQTLVALHRTMVVQMFNGSMSVALYLKCQSDPRCNLAVIISDKLTKHCLSLLIQKFIHNYTR